MPSPIRTLCLILLLLAAIGCEKSGNSSVDLQPVDNLDICLHLEPGDTFRVRQTSQCDMAEEGFWGDHAKYTLELDYTVKCLEVRDNGDMFIEQKWDAARADGVGHGGRFKWDSELNIGIVPVEAKRYFKLLGQSIKALVTPRGAIRELYNAEAIADAILFERDIRPDRRHVSEEEYNRLRDTVADQVFESKELVLDVIPRNYPQAPLSTGDQWTIYETGSATRSAAQETILTLQGVDDQIACFDLAISVSAGADQLERSPVGNVSSQIEAQGQGQAHIDLDRGVFQFAKFDTDARFDQKIDNIIWQNTQQKTMQGTITTTIKILDESI